jgi:hypothetical protein
MQKWEYCYVYGIQAHNPMHTNRPRIAIFSSTEPHLIKTELWNQNQEAEVLGAAKAIAMLGEEGWEMVSMFQEDNSLNGILFFKRQKE